MNPFIEPEGVDFVVESFGHITEAENRFAEKNIAHRKATGEWLKPRLIEILKIDGFQIICLFEDGSRQTFDLQKLVTAFDPKINSEAGQPILEMEMA